MGISAGAPEVPLRDGFVGAAGQQHGLGGVQASEHVGGLGARRRRRREAARRRPRRSHVPQQRLLAENHAGMERRSNVLEERLAGEGDFGRKMPENPAWDLTDSCRMPTGATWHRAWLAGTKGAPSRPLSRRRSGRAAQGMAPSPSPSACGPVERTEATPHLDSECKRSTEVQQPAKHGCGSHKDSSRRGRQAQS